MCTDRGRGEGSYHVGGRAEGDMDKEVEDGFTIAHTVCRVQR